MPSFGPVSMERRRQVHPKLGMVLDRAIQRIAFGIVRAYVDEAEQEAAFNSGASDMHYPDSGHNHTVPAPTPDDPNRREPCAVATDLVPLTAQYPHGDWNSHTGFILIAAAMQAAAADCGVKLRHWPLVLANGNEDRDHWELDESEYEAAA